MKTAINLIKFSVIIIALVWLASCNGKQKVIDQIHAYSDSLGITKNQIIELNRGVDSIRKAYSDKFVATAFDEKSSKKREEWKKQESIAYHHMLNIQRMEESIVTPERIRLQVRCLVFQEKIDSLKLELQK